MRKNRKDTKWKEYGNGMEVEAETNLPKFSSDNLKLYLYSWRLACLHSSADMRIM